MEIFSARRLTNMGLIAAIYVVATMLCSSLAYGQVQFRISEVLMLLCYFNKDYIISLSIGCLIVNLFSTLGMVDKGRHRKADGYLEQKRIIFSYVDPIIKG